MSNSQIKLLIRGGNIFVAEHGELLTGIALSVKVWNTGKPNTVVKWSLTVTPSGIPGETVDSKAMPDVLTLNGPPTTVLRSEDSLERKVEEAEIGVIPKAGTLLFYVRLPKETVLSHATVLRLEAQDSYGESVLAQQKIGDWK